MQFFKKNLAHDDIQNPVFHTKQVQIFVVSCILKIIILCF